MFNEKCKRNSNWICQETIPCEQCTVVPLVVAILPAKCSQCGTTHNLHPAFKRNPICVKCFEASVGIQSGEDQL